MKDYLQKKIYKEKMFRIVLITKLGKIIGKNFNTREQAEDYVLEISEKEGIRRARLKDKKTGIEEDITI